MPSLKSLRASLAEQGYQVSEWADPPGTVYPVRTSDAAQVQWVIRGKLRIGLPERDEEITLGPGDRLELDSNLPYWLDVDERQPVIYLVGIKNGVAARHNGATRSKK